MKQITVNLGERSYPIFIGQELLAKPDLLKSYIPGQKVCIVSNQTVADLYLDELKAQLSDYQLSTVLIEDGEQYKSMTSLNQILDHLLAQNVDRKSTVIALGGGVVGDIAGFAAASCLRGINFIQIPTTLLAQVDSSVGGKTGINHRQGKNLIGAFYQPTCVVVDINTLNTLSPRQFSAGMAEVIKYGLIKDVDFFDWIEGNTEQLKSLDTDKLTYIVARSCQIKADVVSQDEKEAGLRAILNYGHTFGHAIEAAVEYKGWLHGEAISAGMVMASQMSSSMGAFSLQTVNRISNLFQVFDLPISPPTSMTKAQMKELMLHDKKTINQLVRLVLLRNLGEAYVSDDYCVELLDKTIANVLFS